MATGTLSPDPKQTFLDTNGNPLVGGKLYTYLAGTSTLAATYTDVGLSVANANPIILDAAGRAVIYLSPGASYKYILQDATGATIWTQDNINAVPSSSANLDITGTAGEALTAGQAVYLSDGSGGKTAGQWYKADAANAYSSVAAVSVGMVPASITAAGSGTIRLAGSVTGLSSLTLGTTYYVGTAGAMTTTQPTNARLLGIADSTSTLILAAMPGAPNTDNGVNDFRLTLTTGVPVTTSDVTGASAVTIFACPSKGNRISLADSLGNVTMYTSAQFSIAVPGTTSTMYDVFAYNNAGVPTLELLAWTNVTTRATAVVLTTTGFYTKSGDLTRRLLGSVMTGTVSGQTEDSAAKRYLSNAYNRDQRPVEVIETTGTWAYTVNTLRQARATATNQVDAVFTLPDMKIDLTVLASADNASAVNIVVAIGLDSTTTAAAHQVISAGNVGTGSGVGLASATYRTKPAIGRHTFVWLEASSAVGTTNWRSAGNTYLAVQSGIVGFIEG